MGQQQSQQINVPGELAANSVATEKQSATSPSQQSASRAQSRLGTGDYGASHRDWNARAWVETLLGDFPLGSDSGSESARATSATSKSGSGNTFSLGIASANPLVLTWAPNINANLTGTIARDGSLSLSYSTDFFPSHGVQVSRNGKVIHTAITNNAAGVNALGPVGAVNLGAKLMNQGNSGGAVLPGGGVKGKVR